MSSHHFVKEGQEPALFILESVSIHAVEPLLEWVPLIMVADHMLETIIPWGIKIDVVIQHEYSFETLKEVVKDQEPIQILSAHNDILLAGLQFLIQNKNSSVNIICTPTEEILSKIENVGHSLQVDVYDEKEKWSLVVTGNFEKWLPAGAVIAIKQSQDSFFHTEGLTHTEGKHWKAASAGLIKIKAGSPFWVAEEV
ncbi:hypothetical protein [Chryseolinea sp. H1M3-3]|uniref:hypothetical protein n=1 Tax=Chryseolinea sp. H1M3-3 TaxID=3034144 RepID=UPI0023EE24D9|nr:hypothetical protein [Chryseolinea sp. H1M3-3]